LRAGLFWVSGKFICSKNDDFHNFSSPSYTTMLSREIIKKGYLPVPILPDCFFYCYYYCYSKMKCANDVDSQLVGSLA
jgi:hypothetical protein